MMSKPRRWSFATRFRARGFGVHSSRLACQRIREAMTEIRKVARRDHVLGAEGAVRFTVKLVPAIEQALTRPPELIAAIRRFAERIHPSRDGGSSRRVLQAADDFATRGRAGLRPKPVNLVRKFRARQRLGYYRLR